MLVSAVGAFGQGAVQFNNRATTTGGTGGYAPVVSPVFGVDPACPTCPKNGNPDQTWYSANYASAPIAAPTGTQTYGGAGLRGTGFTVQLWAMNATNGNDETKLQLISSTAFRTQTTASLQGFNVFPVTAPIVPDTPSDPSSRAKFQVRAWDNQGGTILSWAQVVDGTHNGVARGFTPVFLLDYQLGGGSITPPNTVGWESFQLFIVPEPSVIALGVLGAGCLFLLRRRK